MKLAIVDTTFSRVDMGDIAIDELSKKFPKIEFIRRTVPGIKDLPVECKRLLDAGDKEDVGCDTAIALGMVGGTQIDQQCAHEASIGIQMAKLMTGKHIIEVFVHENEAWSEEEFVSICENRIRKHVRNAVELVVNPDALVARAGRGIRQGKEDEGPITLIKIPNQKIKIAIVRAKFNEEITDKMEKKAVEICKQQKIEYLIFRVPGVYDIPLPVKKLLMDKTVSGVVTLGAVVKGETAHDEVIMKDCVRRIGELILEFHKPVTLGIIGHEVSWKKALIRAEPYAENAVIAIMDLIKKLDGS